MLSYVLSIALSPHHGISWTNVGITTNMEIIRGCILVEWVWILLVSGRRGRIMLGALLIKSQTIMRCLDQSLRFLAEVIPLIRVSQFFALNGRRELTIAPALQQSYLNE